MPALHDFIPSREAALLAWSRNFDAKINTPPGPGAYGISGAQSAQYTVLHDAYAAAYELAANPATNSKVSITAKNTAKAALKAYARTLSRIVRATPGITNEQRGELGLTVPDPNLTPVLAPSHPPVVSVLPSIGRVIRIRLRDKAAPDRLGKPPGIAGAAVLSFVGEQRTESLSQWTFHGNATRRFFDVKVGSDVPAGSKVWIAAAWYSTRAEFGPASAPACARVGDGVSNFAQAA